MRTDAAVAGMLMTLVLVSAVESCKGTLSGQDAGTGGSAPGGSTGGVPATGGVGGVAGAAGVGGAAGHSLTTVPSQHRAAAMVCSSDAAAAGLPTRGYDGGERGPVDSDGGALISCSTSASCPACSNGLTDRCFSSGGGGGSGNPHCQCDECNSDQDCGQTDVCACEGAVVGQAATIGNVCVSANCRVDADCGPGGFCSPTWFSQFAVLVIDGYYCHTPNDQCRDDADCESSTRCSYSSEAGLWTCFNSGVAG
jgi:hypothetical protein